jgi:hypothetical protein
LLPQQAFDHGACFDRGAASVKAPATYSEAALIVSQVSVAAASLLASSGWRPAVSHASYSGVQTSYNGNNDDSRQPRQCPSSRAA